MPHRPPAGDRRVLSGFAIIGPMNPDFDAAREHFVEGLRALEQGRAADAERCFEASLQRLPGRASTLLNLGVARLRLQRPQEALQALEASLAADPAPAETWGHRGIALARLGRLDEALASFDAALARAPGDAAAAFHRARALGALQRHAEALATLEALLRSDPGEGAVWLQQARTLQCLNRHDDALRSYHRALELDPSLAEAWSLLGQLLRDRGEYEDAARCFEQALQRGADPELNGWLLAAARGGTPPPHTPATYVRGLFDGYAGDFDRHLRDSLHYRAPENLDALLDEAGMPTVAAALDLGCGTGLCGALLRRRAAAVDGVDLSAPMLERARAGGHYRHLHCADLAAHLSDSDERYGLVLAADVFIYVGALDAVFAGVRRVLEPGGRFAFTVEAAGGGVEVELRRSLRYAHGEAHLRALAQAQGLRWLAQRTAPLREDQGRPVTGLHVVLAAP